MKKILLLAAILFFSLNSRATHQSVLEIIYDRVPGTNKYVFTLLEQVEAQTTQFTISLNSNSPAGTFTINRVESIPLNENCPVQNWLNIYKSDTVDLGAIPASGYKFGYTTCCRSPAISNITNPSSTGYYIEVKMYPEPGQSFASSSPRFLNPATKPWLLPSPFALNQPAIDPDGDSIFYALVPVREGTFAANTAVTYTAFNNASGAQPLGAAYPIVINQSQGIFSCANTVPIDVYQFNIEITSYKNNVLTSVVQRDLLTLATPTSPIAPTISLLNYSGSSPIQVSPSGVYQITVKTEDSLKFDINGAILLDSIALAGTSRLFGLTNNTAGNCIGNCADFSPSPNLFGAANATGHFTFVADTTHLLGSDTINYDVVFLAASQGTCKPIMTANLFVRISVVRNSGIGLAENNQLKCSVFPNPSSGLVQIVNPFAVAKKVRLISSFGQEVAAFNVHSGANEINLGSYAKGLYFLVDEAGSCTKIVLR